MLKSIQTIFSVAAAGLIMAGCASAPPDSREEGAGAGIYNFQQAFWGMSRNRVAETVSDSFELVESKPQLLSYKGKLKGKIPVRIEYHFRDGRLIRGSYLFNDNPGQAEYSLIQYTLTKKYGAPVNIGRTESMAEATWEAGPTEIDILARGAHLKDYRPGKIDDTIQIDSIALNYYDRAPYRKEAEAMAKEEKEDRESSELYQRYIGDWVELYPDYYAYDDVF